MASQASEAERYVTTAIVYPNSRIHVGWAWECLGTDWLVRAHRAFDRETYFATGMDEHSLKVQRAAEAKGLEPKAYCDQMATDIRKVLDEIGISYDRFIRTSDEDHERVVRRLIQRSHDKGDIYTSKYEGHYCDGCEAYYLEKDLVDGLCPQHKEKTRWLSEENYFFKLSKYEKDLIELFEENPNFLLPEHRRTEILNFIKAGLEDFSISRSTFTWGIPLPFQEGHVIYVWFDALINYLTAAGVEAYLDDPKGEAAERFTRRWAKVKHIIGKDITRFHCIYWPAMLMSMDLPVPDTVFAHGHLQIKGEKMSKSLGNMITPDEIVAITGPDPFRYYLLAENQFGGDGNFALDALVTKFNADLANDWGNLVNRTISMTRKYFPDQEMKQPEQVTHSGEVKASFAKLLSELEKAIEAVDPAAYASACLERSRVLNLYIDKTKPWKLAKEEGKKDELYEVLYTLLEGIRWTATAFLPLLPFKMPEVYKQLGVSPANPQGALKSLRWGGESFKPEKPEPIYPRLELEKD